MVDNSFVCTLETRVSKKTNNSYRCLVIKINDTYSKPVFLTEPELALIDTELHKRSTSSFDSSF